MQVEKLLQPLPKSMGLTNNNPTADWDGLIYTFCYRSKDEECNGYYPTYCIESWGKTNTVMLMEMFEDYNYSITCREHDYIPQNDT